MSARAAQELCSTSLRRLTSILGSLAEAPAARLAGRPSAAAAAAARAPAATAASRPSWPLAEFGYSELAAASTSARLAPSLPTPASAALLRFAAAPGAAEELRADSVKRKRKTKMNKHKHAKRRKLERHRK
jgi:hypothetical protein